MTNKQIAAEIKQQSKTENYSDYSKKYNEHKGQYNNARKAKEYLKSL